MPTLPYANIATPKRRAAQWPSSVNLATPPIAASSGVVISTVPAYSALVVSGHMGGGELSARDTVGIVVSSKVLCISEFIGRVELARCDLNHAHQQSPSQRKRYVDGAALRMTQQSAANG